MTCNVKASNDLLQKGSVTKKIVSYGRCILKGIFGCFFLKKGGHTRCLKRGEKVEKKKSKSGRKGVSDEKEKKRKKMGWGS